MPPKKPFITEETGYDIRGNLPAGAPARNVGALKRRLRRKVGRWLKESRAAIVDGTYREFDDRGACDPYLRNVGIRFVAKPR